MYLLLLGGLVGLSGILEIYRYSKGKGGDVEDGDLAGGFGSFQRNYLLVYFLVMGADWLQGPYIYALYASYGFSQDEIAQLFIVGFVSSMVLGTYAGGVADTLGRRRLALVFAVLYSASCVTKLSTGYWVLMLGRLLSGVATSLLFSVFESWMVHEHHRLGFSNRALSLTFSRATFGNGVVAVVSGVVASYLADKLGYVAPHMAAIVLLVAAGVVVAGTWPENYGSESGAGAASLSSFSGALAALSADRSVLMVGVVQSLFEGSMYTFVFMWTPRLTSLSSATPPFGLVFAAFMVAIMIGSAIFSEMLARVPLLTLWRANLVMAAAAFAVMAAVPYESVAMAAFVLFEISCGVYFPSQGMLRERYIPEQVRSTVMNFFRVPLNFLVVIVLVQVGKMDESTVFWICTFWIAIAAALSLLVSPKSNPISDEEAN